VVSPQRRFALDRHCLQVLYPYLSGGTDVVRFCGEDSTGPSSAVDHPRVPSQGQGLLIRLEWGRREPFFSVPGARRDRYRMYLSNERRGNGENRPRPSGFHPVAPKARSGPRVAAKIPQHFVVSPSTVGAATAFRLRLVLTGLSLTTPSIRIVLTGPGQRHDCRETKAKCSR
jgi:hypothetical protein